MTGSPPEPGPARSAWRDVTLIAAAALALLIPSLFTRDLWNPDEPRYMEVAREMVELRGEAWIVPRLNGELYGEKPPLFFWAAAALYRAGAGLAAGRLVSVLSGLGAALLLYAGVRRFRGPSAGLSAALVLLTSLLFLDETKTGVINPFFALLTTAATVLGLLALHEERVLQRAAAWLAAYLALGLAFLAKGPVALLVSALPLAVYGVWNRRAVRGGGWTHLAGVVLLLLPAGLWLVAAAHAEGWDYVESITIGQVERRVVDSDSHRGPPWEYLVHYPGHFFPWSLLFLPAAALAVRRWRTARDPLSLFGLVWFVLPFLAFSAVSGKRGGYLLPLVPGFAAIVGLFAAEVREGLRARPAGRALLLATGSLAALLGAALLTAAAIFAVDPGVFERAKPEYADAVRTISAASAPGRIALQLATALLVAGIGVATIRAAQRHRPALGMTLLGVWAVAASLHVDLFLNPVLNEVKSARRFVEEGAPWLVRAREVRLFGSDYSGFYNLHTGRTRMPEIGDRDALRTALSEPGVAVIADQSKLERKVPDRLWNDAVRVRRRVGHRTMVILSGAASLPGELGGPAGR